MHRIVHRYGYLHLDQLDDPGAFAKTLFCLAEVCEPRLFVLGNKGIVHLLQDGIATINVQERLYRAPALPPVGRWEKGAPVLPEERARTKPSAPFSGHCVCACVLEV